ASGSGLRSVIAGSAIRGRGRGRGVAVVNDPSPGEEARAGDRGARECTHDEAAEEALRATALATQQVRQLGEACRGRVADGSRQACLVGHRQAFARCGPSVARIATIPIPTQAMIEAEM